MTFTLRAPQTTYSATRITADAYVKTSDVVAAVRCTGWGTGACYQQLIPATAYANAYTPNVATTAQQLLTKVTDDTSHQVICSSSTASSDLVGCTLPARAANQPPHSYTISIELNTAFQLAPPFVPGFLGGFVDQLVGATYFTTAQPAPDALVVCTDAHTVGTYTSPDYHWECGSTAHYEHVSALRQAKLEFPAYSIELTTARSPGATFTAPANLPASATHIDARTWDSGDNGL